MTEDNRAAVNFGKALAAARVERGMKRMDLKNESGVSYPYIAEIENGGKYPSQVTIAKLAKALDLTPFDLLTRAEALEQGDYSVQSSASRPGPELMAAPPQFQQKVAGLPPRSESRAAMKPPSSLDELVDRVTAEVYRSVQPRIEEWTLREIRLAVREELLRQREGG